MKAHETQIINKWIFLAALFFATIRLNAQNDSIIKHESFIRIKNLTTDSVSLTLLDFNIKNIFIAPKAITEYYKVTGLYPKIGYILNMKGRKILNFGTDNNPKSALPAGQYTFAISKKKRKIELILEL